MTPPQKNVLIAGSFIALVLLLIGAAFLIAGRREAGPGAGEKLTVAATIFPLADIARTIAGDRAEVVLIIPPGISEHSSGLSPRQLQRLQAARVIFQIGHGLDTALTARISAAAANPRLVTVDRGITLREFGDTGVDPHYWLTVPNAGQIAQTISQTLQEIDPQNAAHYKLQTTNYLAELDALEQELQAQARTIRPKEFIAMHDAWSYFADHYGLRLVATYEPVEGQTPALADIERLREIIQQHSLAAFYAEPQKQATSAVRFIADDLGLAIKVLDPVGGLGGRDSYPALMRENMAALASP